MPLAACPPVLSVPCATGCWQPVLVLCMGQWLPVAAQTCLPRQSAIRDPRSEIAVAPAYRLRLGIDGLNMPLWCPVLSKEHAFPTAGTHGTREGKAKEHCK